MSWLRPYRYQSMVTQAMSSTKEFVSVFAIDESTEQNQPPCCARIGSVISIREIRTEVEGRWFVDVRSNSQLTSSPG